MRQSSRSTKQIYRSLFLALQADAKKYPGGISALAGLIGVNGNTLANNLNPDHESLPPSFSTVLEIILQAQAKSTVFALSQFVGQVPMDIDLSANDTDQRCQIKTFLALISSSSDLLKEGSEAAKNFHFDASERRKILPMLLSLMQVTSQLYNAFNE